MLLISNNTDIIYLDGSTDPYTNNDGSAMLDENQTTCDNVIGSANYDIGHVFSTDGGGVAWRGGVCKWQSRECRFQSTIHNRQRHLAYGRW